MDHRAARYAIRNALLAQVTGLRIVLGQIVLGGLLVEAVFHYRGLGDCVASDPGQGLFPKMGHRAYHHRVDGICHVAPRSQASSTRPAGETLGEYPSEMVACRARPGAARRRGKWMNT